MTLPGSRSVDFRRGTAVALLADALAAAASVGLDLHGPVRVVTVLIALCLLPGAAVLTAVPVTDQLAWLGLATVLSLGIGTLLACGMLVAHWWHPGAFGAVGLLCAGVLVADLARGRRARKGPAAPAGPAGTADRVASGDAS